MSDRPARPSLRIAVSERPARARTITRQPKLAGPHPLGTPRTFSPNTGALAAAAWLLDRGILPDQERWFVELDLGGTDSTGRETRFVLEVYSEEWGFQVHHLGQTSWIRVTDVPFVHGRDDHGMLARIPRLREIGLFVRELERRFRVHFDRDAARIHTSIPDAEPVLRAWIGAL